MVAVQYNPHTPGHDHGTVTAGASPIHRAEYSSQVYNCRTRRKDHVRFDLRTPGHDLGIRTPGHDHCTVLIIIVILHCPFCRIVRGRLFYDQRGSFTIICGLIVVRGF